MEHDQLFDAIMGFYAWDMGCRDSGIHDVLLAQRVKQHLHDLNKQPGNLLNKVMAELVDRYMTCPEARDKGYGFEDVVSFVRWFTDWSGLDW
jgi:hypothetical protein